MVPHVLGLALLLAQPPNDPTALINRELALQWETQNLTPSDKTDDLEFLRRASLDLIGRIPTLQEQEAYLTDQPTQRRKLLVDRLLDHDDYARHWANNWTNRLLGTAAAATDTRLAFHGWLAKHFARNGSHKELAEKLLTATGTTRDNPAVHFFVAHRGQAIPEKEWTKLGQYDMVPLTGHVFRVLHGRRLQCVQCHGHPFSNDLHQADFHQFNLFFRQVRFTHKPAGTKKDVLEISDDPEFNKSALMHFERRNGAISFTAPKFYQGDTWKPGMKQTRREFFAERFLKHPHFAQAYVNFTWTQLFGHGLTQGAHDDMGSHNDILHERIMDRLTMEFIKSDHNPKALLRWICNSNAYGLKSVANKTNAGPENVGYFARMESRPLSRQQLAESLIVALTTEDYLKRREGLRHELLREYLREDLLGETHPLRSADVSHCEAMPLDAEADFSIRHALWLINGAAINREITEPKGTVANILKTHGTTEKALPSVIRDLFRITLCRPPTPQELRRLCDPKSYKFRSKEQPAIQVVLTNYCQDLFWAMLNTNEFTLNH